MQPLPWSHVLHRPLAAAYRRSYLRTPQDCHSKESDVAQLLTLEKLVQVVTDLGLKTLLLKPSNKYTITFNLPLFLSSSF